MWDFEHGDGGQNFEIEYTIPSQCAAALGRGPGRHRNHPGHHLRRDSGLGDPAQHCDRRQGPRALDPAGQQEADRRRAHGCDRHVVPNLGRPDAGPVRQVFRRTSRVHAASARPEGDAQAPRRRAADWRLGSADLDARLAIPSLRPRPRLAKADGKAVRVRVLGGATGCPASPAEGTESDRDLPAVARSRLASRRTSRRWQRSGRRSWA